MREIKFRALNTRSGKWEYFEFDQLVVAGFRVDYHWLKHWSRYTGLKDREGREIYEGDIWGRDGFIAVVEIKYSGWHLTTTPKSNSIQYPSFYSNAATGEVIGNVHEHPELAGT